MKRAAIGLVVALTAGGAAEAAPAKSGCNTKRCLKRVEIKHMKRVVRKHKGWLRATRMCESGGNYNQRGYHRGAYQFTWQTWRAAGGKPADAADATKLRQDYTAIKWANMIGWNNVRTSAGWPNCAGGR